MKINESEIVLAPTRHRHPSTVNIVPANILVRYDYFTLSFNSSYCSVRKCRYNPGLPEPNTLFPDQRLPGLMVPGLARLAEIALSLSGSDLTECNQAMAPAGPGMTC